ncbi:hypothetical protein GCM10022631_40300 [Deinococcus rubellus]|uniref:Intracellular proteinase inhibitor BsuPI domain-containing protein n=1 Tax=Deinococcus rubellus TaxID=1889240 RepID=A0ABY5YMF5_9DEIO|nr:hypothetical protein [Deinococcus rubellus]UWX65512.1 hypothetical protein N0D28_07645 [Deinococcus rubellus]
MNKVLPLLFLGVLMLPAALAQTNLPEIPPVNQPLPIPAQPAPLPPIPAQPAPLPPIPTQPSPPPTLILPAPVILDKVGATLSAPRTVSGEFTLSLSLKNDQAAALDFSAGRDSEQNCAAAPSLRVLQVGTRAVIYPTGEKRICTQEQQIQTAPAGGSATFTRTLTLPAGEYMVEGWFQGFAGKAGQQVKVSAQPVRISVK